MPAHVLQVLIATDADEAGDEAASRITAQCGSYGSDVARLRPAGGCKDWNDVVQRHGAETARMLVGLRLARLQGSLEAHADPRADFADDSNFWIELLTIAAFVDVAGHGLYAVLHSARCCGVQLAVDGRGGRLLPGELRSSILRSASSTYVRMVFCCNCCSRSWSTDRVTLRAQTPPRHACCQD